MRLLVPAAAAVLLLAGCGTPAAAPPSSSTPTPEPTVTAAPALACADLIPLADLQAVITTPLSVKLNEQSPPQGSADLVLLQAGGVRCVWGGEDRTDGMWVQGLHLGIVPAVEADFEAILAASTFPDDAVFDTIGDRSELDCYTDGSFCSGLLFVGQRLVSVSLTNYNSDPLTLATAQSLVGTVAAAIEQTSPNAPIVAEPGGFDGGEACSDPAIVASAFGVDATGVAVMPIDLGPGLYSVAEAAVENVRCSWNLGQDAGGASITVVPGAGWQFTRMQEQPDGVGGRLQGPATSIPIEGAEGALVSCGDGCWAGVLYEGAVVELYAGEIYDQAEMEAVIVAFVAALH